MAVLQENILSVEEQGEMVLRMREAGKFLDTQIWETPVLQVEEIMELATKESVREEILEEAWQFF